MLGLGVFAIVIPAVLFVRFVSSLDEPFEPFISRLLAPLWPLERPDADMFCHGPFGLFAAGNLWSRAHG
jgi:hypothetical protein